MINFMSTAQVRRHTIKRFSRDTVWTRNGSLWATVKNLVPLVVVVMQRNSIDILYYKESHFLWLL
jgi:hypothetical protein